MYMKTKKYFKFQKQLQDNDEKLKKKKKNINKWFDSAFFLFPLLVIINIIVTIKQVSHNK